LRLPDFETIDI